MIHNACGISVADVCKRKIQLCVVRLLAVPNGGRGTVKRFELNLGKLAGPIAAACRFYVWELYRHNRTSAELSLGQIDDESSIVHNRQSTSSCQWDVAARKLHQAILCVGQRFDLVDAVLGCSVFDRKNYAFRKTEIPLETVKTAS